MAYGLSSGVPPQEAPIMIAKKRRLFPFLFFSVLASACGSSHFFFTEPLTS